MSSLIPNFSRMLYIEQINQLNYTLDFDAFTANIDIGSYSPTNLLANVKEKMDDAGDQIYTVAFDRDTNRVTISAPLPFDMDFTGGTTIGGVLGYNLTTYTGSNSYTAENDFASVFEPQFLLQSYVGPDDWKEKADAVVNVAASGDVEAVHFGEVEKLQFEIKFQTKLPQGGLSVIKNDPQGLENFRAFMVHATKKWDFEFEPNINDSSTFYTLILDTTELSQTGTGFKIIEMWDQNLPAFFRSGLLTFRRKL